MILRLKVSVKNADTALDKSGYDGSAREDELNKILKDFKGATERVKTDHAGESGKKNLGNVLHFGVSIEQWLKKYPLDGVQDDWTTLRSELGELASGFGVTWKEGEGYATGTPVAAVDVKNLCMHIEDVADHFREALDDALDKSKLNNTSTEDEINGYVRDFRNATNDLQDHYNEEARAKDDAKEVLTRANKIDGFMHKHKDVITPEIQTQWELVRNDLDRLAKYYNVNWRWQQ